MELLITVFTLVFLSIQAYEHKWFLENLHQYGKGEKRHAQNKWHFWANVMRFCYVGSITFVGIMLTFVLSIKLIPVMIITMVVGGHYFTWFLNKIRGLDANHIGNGWWDRNMSSTLAAWVSVATVGACLLWYFYN
jgi:hypothetical protein